MNIGGDIKIIVFEDSVFLPKEVSSLYEYYAFKQNDVKPEEKELFYDFLEVPIF